jgi:CCR4-NOT transcription complex subunit 3
MENFKICEKDTKTKAYSKEGLAREARLDPKEAEKEDKRIWLNESIEKLEELIDSIEADIEKNSNGRAKSKNKELIEKMEKRILKNRWHIARLEQILRLLDGDDLDPAQLDDIKDGVDYYIESAKDDDGAFGVEDEFDIYEELQLDLLPASSVELKEEEEDSSSNTNANINSSAITVSEEPSEKVHDSDDTGFTRYFIFSFFPAY